LTTTAGLPNVKSFVLLLVIPIRAFLLHIYVTKVKGYLYSPLSKQSESKKSIKPTISYFY